MDGLLLVRAHRLEQAVCSVFLSDVPGAWRVGGVGVLVWWVGLGRSDQMVAAVDILVPQRAVKRRTPPCSHTHPHLPNCPVSCDGGGNSGSCSTEALWEISQCVVLRCLSSVFGLFPPCLEVCPLPENSHYSCYDLHVLCPPEEPTSASSPGEEGDKCSGSASLLFD